VGSVTRKIRKQVVRNRLRQLAPKVPVWELLKNTPIIIGRLAMAEWMIVNDKVEEFAKKGVEALKRRGIPVEE
jgi:hypothetical protein